MKIRILFVACLLFALGAQAQKYTTAVGGRLGGGLGLTVQQKLWKKTTLEAIVNQRLKQDEVVMTFLLERHHNLIGKGFNMYLGAGPHIGWGPNETNGEGETLSRPIGLTGVAGVEIHHRSAQYVLGFQTGTQHFWRHSVFPTSNGHQPALCLN